MPVPHRRLAAPPLVLALPLVLATAALATGCSIAVAPGSVPVPFSVAPTPSASAVRLAEFAGNSGDKAADGMRQTFTDMAGQVDAEAARTTDADLKKALGEISTTLTDGARQPDPKTFVNGDFQTVGQKLDGHCD
jgi:hypothetical protein